jgi:hypothetical protein
VGEGLAKFVVVIVVGVWVASTLVLPVAVRGYTPPAELGTIMGAVAGGAVAYLFAKRADGGGK